MIELCVKIPKDLNDILSQTGAAFYVDALGDFRKRIYRRFDNFSKVVKSFRLLNRYIHFQKSP